MAAPGTNIISVYNRGYGMASGTSFAAPQVSAAADVLIQEYPYLTNAQILQILFQSATKIAGSGRTNRSMAEGRRNLDAPPHTIGSLSMPTGYRTSVGPSGSTRGYDQAERSGSR